MRFLQKVLLNKYSKDMSINKFDIIYYINCEHRTDRRIHIEGVLNHLEADKNKIKRIEAVYIEENGSLGCCRSHLIALNDFKESGLSNALIVEDDFMFFKKRLIDNFTNMFFDSLGNNWDIIMYSANIINRTGTNLGFLSKVLEAQTTSCYGINSRFTDKLIENFKESEKWLSDGGNKHIFAIDQNWKKLQPQSDWYAFNPLIGKQMDGYSDIEKTNVSYRC